jgi:hypothetical protein
MVVMSPGVDRGCVTHHHACDCREDAFDHARETLERIAAGEVTLAVAQGEAYAALRILDSDAPAALYEHGAGRPEPRVIDHQMIEAAKERAAIFHTVAREVGSNANEQIERICTVLRVDEDAVWHLARALLISYGLLDDGFSEVDDESMHGRCIVSGFLYGVVAAREQIASGTP